MDGLILVNTAAPTRRGDRVKSVPQPVNDEMTQAVNGVLSACGLTRETFADGRNSAILAGLSSHLNDLGSNYAALVTGIAADVARTSEGMIRKTCPDCQREFWVDGQMAQVVETCERADCK